jgi:hypothetical protein
VHARGSARSNDENKHIRAAPALVSFALRRGETVVPGLVNAPAVMTEQLHHPLEAHGAVLSGGVTGTLHLAPWHPVGGETSGGLNQYMSLEDTMTGSEWASLSDLCAFAPRIDVP